LSNGKETELQSLREHYEMFSQKEATLQFSQWKQENETAIRKDAIERSRAVTVGKVTEHVVPFLPEFQHNPKDARFLGTPVDLVVFDGLDAGAVEKITFIEVKTGASSLTKRERQIREAINRGAVVWEELRLPSLPSISVDGSMVGLTIETIAKGCPQCQRKNRPQATFCGYCGNAL
jgi:predicted Holliday junction resolvase-like endonuclease